MPRKQSIGFCLPLLLLLAVSCNGGPLTQETSWFGRETFSSRAGNPSATTSGFPKVEGDSDIVSSLCQANGVFAKHDSCTDYYHCEELTAPRLYSIHLLSCPLGRIFDEELKSCEYPQHVSSRPDCQNVNGNDILYEIDAGLDNAIFPGISGYPIQRFNRQKRFAIIPALTGILSHPLAKAAAGLFGTFRKSRKSDGGGVDLKALESKLVGIDGKLKQVQLSVLESQAENKMSHEILQNLFIKGTEENNISFKQTQKMINQGILENQISSAVIQGLISEQSRANEYNFGKVQVSLGELKSFINNEITDTKAIIKTGFESVSNLINQAKVEPLVSKLLTTIENFNKRSDHIQSLPEDVRIDGIKRSGGYLEYLESSTLQDSLRNMIQQNLAIPENDSDLSAVFILELLVNGLQVDTNMMSSIVLSNGFLAAKSLEETNVEDFNTYMLRVTSSLARLSLELGNGGRQGLIVEVKQVLDKVQSLPFASNIVGLSKLLAEKRSEIEQIELEITNLIADSTELSMPGTIKGKPNFVSTPVSVPLGSWEKGKHVSYAIQHVSDTGMSRVGAWSAPYYIIDKANPTIELSIVPQGVVRAVYRRLGKEKPELVAVIRNHQQKIFRDIDRDLLNAAAKPNEDQAVQEVTALTSAGADVNAVVGNKLTPLHNAAKYGNVKVMEILIGKSANVHAKTSDNEEPLHFAALFGTSAGVEYLLSKGAAINAQTRSLGLSPLHIAVANNHAGVARTLIKKGAFVNIKDNNGLTPLHISVAGNGDTTEVLLESDTIDVNAIANDGLTPLHYGARSSNDVFVRKLLQHRDIDINPQTDYLLSPLHLAAMSDNIVDISELVQRGVPASVKDASGSSPLHYAAFYGNQKSVLTLMQIDESLTNAKNNEEKTALDLAVENNREGVANILRGNIEDVGDIFANEPVYPEPATVINTGISQLVATNCTSDTVEQMAKSSEETCAHIGNVDAYVNLVMTMIPLQIYYETQQEYSELFSNYDKDLIAAQGHAKIWKDGDSIVMGIRKTFGLAKEFEPEFSRKYKINQQRVEVIKENVDQVRLINETKENIQKLEMQLASAKEAMSQVQVEAVLVYFRATVTGIEAEIAENNRSLNEDFTLIQELEELVDFLEFVRRDSDKIRTVALSTRGKIEEFKRNLQHDKGAFERHANVSHVTLERLQQETIKHNEALAENKRKQEELDRKMEEERQQVKALFTKINHSHEELRKMRRKLLDKISKQKTLKIIGAILSPIVVGAFLYAYASQEEKKYTSLLQGTMNANKLEVDDLTAQIESNQKQITFLQQTMANSTSNSENLRNDLNDFITLDGDLNVMGEKAETLIEAINKALVGVTVIKGVFDDVTEKLGEMIDLARTAKTEAERLNAKFFIYNELSALECNWRDVYYKVMNLNECTRTYEILY